MCVRVFVWGSHRVCCVNDRADELSVSDPLPADIAQSRLDFAQGDLESAARMRHAIISIDRYLMLYVQSTAKGHIRTQQYVFLRFSTYYNLYTFHQ